MERASGTTEFRKQLSPRKPRMGLQRGTGARQMLIPCGNLEATRSLIRKQQHSLAKLAGQSMRQLPTQRLSLTSSENGDELDPEPNNRDIVIGVMDVRGDRKDAPPLQRMDSLGIDEMSLEVLCWQVAERLGGAPSRPMGLHALEPIEREDSSVSLDFSGDIKHRGSDFDISLVDLDQQLQEMRLIEAEVERERASASMFNASAPALTANTSSGSSVLRNMFNASAPAFKADESSDEFVASNTTVDYEGEDRVEVTPGKFLPLLGSSTTFRALSEGCICFTKCLGCNTDLMVVQTADLVICSDCWICSPVTRYGADGKEIFDDRPPKSVGIGVKQSDVKLWLERHSLAEE